MSVLMHPEVAEAPSPGRTTDHGSLGWVDRMLALPLLQKILWANVGMLLAVLGAAVTLLPGRDVSGWTALLVMAAILFWVASVNLVLVYAALLPIRELTDTAARVEAGDENARVVAALVSDPEISRLVRVFNRMLDCREEQRVEEQARARSTFRKVDAERTRSAELIYDGLAQDLAGVLLRLRVMAERAGNPGSNMGDTPALAEIRDHIAEVLEGVRGIARRLHPPELEELGLIPALEALARSTAEQSGVPIAVSGDVSPRLARDEALAVFRVVEEALSNVTEHSEASHARIDVRLVQEMLEIEVTDDGHGFDPADPETEAGDGMEAMTQRARQAGGNLTIIGRPGRGTRVRLSVPVAHQFA